MINPHRNSPSSAANPLRLAKANLVVAVIYGLLVMAMWFPYGPQSGMSYETTFSQWSETKSLWSGFFFNGDPLRPHTNTFYHLSYLLSFALGIPGSFLTFGLVYSVLWWARGFLAYLILQEFQPQHALFNLFVGTLILTHAADGALQWVGQMNQFGVISWMLAAFMAGLCFTRSRSWWTSALSLLLAAFCLYMSLWSYEAHLPLVTLLPLSLFVLKNRSIARRWLFAGVWYAVEAAYIAQAALRYLSQTDSAYQQSVLKKSGLSFGQLASDWWFNIREGLHFTQWAEALPTAVSLAPASAVTPSPLLLWGLIAAAVASLLFLAWRWTLHPATKTTGGLPDKSRLLRLTGVGAALFVFSFPVFLLLDTARGLWRTQFMASLGYGLLIVAVAALLASLIPRRLRVTAFCILCMIPLSYGLRAAIKRGEFHYGIWERHRFAMAQVLHVAPSVAAGSTIILTNVPKDSSPFGDNMWYLVALQLAYPRTYLAGVYFHSDGSPSPSFSLKPEGSDWIWNGTGWPPEEPRRFPLAKTIIIQFSPLGTPELLQSVPDYIPGASEWKASYAPQQAILTTPPALDYGQRRYLKSGQIK